jgi:hypothetical protein
MNFLKPYLWYLVCAVILCILYYGLEQSHGGLGFMAKTIMCCWCLFSFIITIALFGVQTGIETGIGAPPQAIAITIGASIITLCISSSLVYCAQ